MQASWPGSVGNLGRINLIADADGAGAVVFKDRQSNVVARIYLDAANQLWFEFSD